MSGALMASMPLSGERVLSPLVDPPVNEMDWPERYRRAFEAELRRLERTS
jgi:hypothetical protein